jgi:formate-dependent nitrite reductase membrane component NrfD
VTGRAALEQGYHDRPILKPHVWKPAIGAYFVLGGLAGASSVLAAGADVAGNPPLARTARLTSAAAISACPPLLIYDLGRPERFLNMLRVFKPTSPMSMGTWTLLAASGAQLTATACDVTGLLPRLGRTAQLAAAALGPVMATYTGVLVSDTAVPAWVEARRELPALFAAGAAASAGAAAVVAGPATAAGPARRLALAGAIAELGVQRAMERRLGALAEPYREGSAATFTKASRALTAGGAAAMALGGRRRAWLTRSGAVATLAGAACARFAVLDAGHRSATDPRHVVRQQRG